MKKSRKKLPKLNGKKMLADLDGAETSTATAEPVANSDIDQVLVRTLAAMDALFLGIRSWSGHLSANKEHGLSMLETHGVPLRVGGNQQTRKSGERTLIEAAEAGLVILRRHGRERFPYLKLTPRSEAYARALVGLPDRAGGRQMLVEVASKTDRRPQTLDRLFLDEVALNGGRGWGESTKADRQGLFQVELRFLPAASAGWLVANTTVHGHCRYSVTTAGWKELDYPSTPPDVGELPLLDLDAENLYFRERDARRAELTSCDPEKPGDLGALPLPVGHVGSPIGAYRRYLPALAPMVTTE